MTNGLCVDCNKIRTTNKTDEEFVCASCSNNRYFTRVSNGEIKELKLDMRKIKRSTYLQILALIEKDMEEWKEQKDK